MPSVSPVIFGALGAFGLAAAAVALLVVPVRRLALLLGALDHPGGRHGHLQPTPVLGGLAIVGGTALAAGVSLGLFSLREGWGSIHDLSIALGATIMLLAAGFVDDVRGLSWRPKMVVQVVVITLAVSTMGGIPMVDFGVFRFPAWFWVGSMAFTVFWILTVVNAYNLVDGLDGLAAGTGIMAAGSLGVIGLFLGNGPVAVALFALSGALCGFWIHNRHPARIFMGDTGAMPVGFLLGILGVMATAGTEGWAFLPVGIALGVPLAEVTLSVARRALRPWGVVRVMEGTRRRYSWIRLNTPGVFVGDRRHLHHRLIDLGLGYSTTVRLLVGASAVLGILAIVATMQPRIAPWMATGATLLVGVLAMNLLYEELDVRRRGTFLPFPDAGWVRTLRVRVLHDAVFIAAAPALTFLLLEVERSREALGLPAGLLPSTSAPTIGLATASVAVLVPLLWAGGFYRTSFRQAELAWSVRAGGCVFAAALATGWCLLSILVPYSGPGIYPLVFASLATFPLFASRLAFRWLEVRHLEGEMPLPAALIYGAGRRGRSLLESARQNPVLGYRPAGFLDDDPALVGRRIGGLPVLGGVESLERATAETGARLVVLATSSLSEERLHHLASRCAASGWTLLPRSGTGSLLAPPTMAQVERTRSSLAGVKPPSPPVASDRTGAS